MKLIPAIDLKDGQCVRLLKGDFGRKTVYGSDPALMARRWADLGADLIHVVDLDGSLGDNERNRRALADIRRAVDVALELGGGLRTLEGMGSWIGLGVDRLVLGTAVCLDQDLVRRACGRWPGRILAALDARGGRLVVRGWLEDGGLDLLEAAGTLADLGVGGVIYTDVERDGTREGPNLDTAALVARTSGLPTIISGGVATLDDLRAAAARREPLFSGVISGKALYEGVLDYRAGAAVLAARAGGGADTDASSAPAASISASCDADPCDTASSDTASSASRAPVPPARPKP